MDADATTVLGGMKSPPWSKVVLVFHVFELLLLGVYALLFFQTPIEAEGSALSQLRGYLLPAIPFILLLHFFVLGLWVHALYADAHHVFHEHDLRPQQAMLMVLVPIVNIYGFGRTLSRLAGMADRYDKDRTFKRHNILLKYGLVVFYAALAGILLSLYYTVNMPDRTAEQAKAYYLLFNSLQFILVAGAVAGASLAVVGSQSIVKHQWHIEYIKASN